MRPLPTVAAILLALGAIEALAWWWMHPALAGLGQPVLAYRPVGLDRRARPLVANGAESQGSVVGDQLSVVGELDSVRSSTTSALHRQPTTDNSSLLPSPSSPNLQSPISYLPSTPSSLALLPEIVSRALPSLRCTTGTAARIDRDNGATIHLAFFEWDADSATNVLEAFRHLPEECMGSIGMTLVKKHPPRSYVVRGQGAGDRDQLSVVGCQFSEDGELDAGAKLSNKRSLQTTDNRQPTTDNSSFLSSSLSFDHTEFRDPSGVIVHAFKGTWVSGANELLGPGVRGGGEQWRQIQWNAVLKRFRPAHARVAQGAVRSIRNPDLAWQAFEDAMLKNLIMKK